MDTDLPPDYYHANFRKLIDFVANLYSDLLEPEELQWHLDFVALKPDAQRLYVRLLCRSPVIFRQSKLKYDEISSIAASAKELSAKDFLSIDARHSIDDLLPLFTKPELIQNLSLNQYRRLKRADLTDFILTELDLEDTLSAMTQAGESFLALRRDGIFDIYRLCFFGNLHQDMTDFVLSDLGLTKFEAYALNDQTRAFQSRAQLTAHLQYYNCSELAEEALLGSPQDILTLSSKLPLASSADSNLSRRCERLINRLARQLERLDSLDDALSLYRSTTRAPSRERQVRILHKIGSLEEALALCKGILEDPANDEEHEFAVQFSVKVAKAMGVEATAPKKFKPATDTIEIVRSGDSVELLAADFYAAHFAQSSRATDQVGICFFTENVLFTGVFGLAFWDVIFASVNGAFHHPFQWAPADFSTSDFVQARTSIISATFDALISSDALREIVKTKFLEKRGIHNPMINWKYLSESLVEKALDRIPLAHWLAVFHRLLDDLSNNRNGFPDLIVFPDAGGYQLIEIKGPGDTLQKNQLRWMRYFHQHGLPCSVSHVIWKNTTGSEEPIIV